MYRKIKLTFPYPDWPILRQTVNYEGRWGKYQFYVNPDLQTPVEFDYWVVFNFPLQDSETTICRRGNVILITGEPESIEPYSNRYVNQFDHLITGNQNFNHKNKWNIPQGLPWFVNKSYDELASIKSVDKSKKISIVSSTKNRSEGHRHRLDFALKLKEYFGDAIDLYGRGINSFDDKWDVLAPYKYSIALENVSQKYYFTEKIMDCYLSFTFPIYFGCKNIEDYFDPKSFREIDMYNFKAATQVITELLEDDMHYGNRMASLVASREKVLTEYNLFPLIVNFIEKKMPANGENEIKEHTIDSLHFNENLFKKIVRKINNAI